MLYRIEAGLRENLPDPAAAGLAQEMKTLGLTPPQTIRTARLYWIEGDFDRDAALRVARELFSDAVVENVAVNEPVYDDAGARLVEIVRKPGVMDPAVASIRKGLSDRKLSAGHIGTGRKYLFFFGESLAATDEEILLVARKVLANECIEEIHLDKPAPVHAPGGSREFQLAKISLAGKNDAQLIEISKQGCLSLTAPEMRAIQKHYEEIGRDPTAAGTHLALQHIVQ